MEQYVNIEYVPRALLELKNILVQCLCHIFQ